MSEIKIGSRVRVVTKNSYFAGLVGKVIKIGGLWDHRVLFNDGTNSEFDKEDLQLVDPSFRTLLVGDTVVVVDGEAKVLEVGVNTFIKSDWGNFSVAGDLFTFKEAENYGWTVKGQEEENITELSMDEVAKLAGVDVKFLKIKKE